jgi:hypothetical protein
MIEELAGKKAIMESLPARQQEIWNFLPNHNLQRSLADYAETPLSIGLKTTWDFINLPAIKEEYDEIQTRH